MLKVMTILMGLYSTVEATYKNDILYGRTETPWVTKLEGQENLSNVTIETINPPPPKKKPQKEISLPKDFYEPAPAKPKMPETPWVVAGKPIHNDLAGVTIESVNPATESSKAVKTTIKNGTSTQNKPKPKESKKIVEDSEPEIYIPKSPKPVFNLPKTKKPKTELPQEERPSDTNNYLMKEIEGLQKDSVPFEETEHWVPPVSKDNHNELPGVNVEDFDPSQEIPPPSGPVKSKARSKEKKSKRPSYGNYRLQGGDQLVIGVYGDPNTLRNVSVDPSGAISYLFVNALQVQGKTIGEIRNLIEERLKKYYRDPLVTISLAEPSPQHYVILGEVRQPGRHVIKGNTTLLSAICEARGFTLYDYRNETYEQADLGRSFLARNGEFVPIDFEKLIKQGDTNEDILLRDGDYIHISSMTMDKVYILGEVRHPLTLSYLDTMTLSEALAEAGGVNLRASSRVAVIRGSLCCPTQYLIDVNRILKGYASDVTLEPGDIVYVPSMRFWTIREIVQSAIRTFVGTAASAAGTRAFIEIQPKAAGTNLNQPVPVINTTGATFVNPVVPVFP